MVGRGVAVLGIGVAPAPCFERGAVDNEVASADEPAVQRLPHCPDEERLAGGSARAPRVCTSGLTSLRGCEPRLEVSLPHSPQVRTCSLVDYPA
jgi:hypothetical protein